MGHLHILQSSQSQVTNLFKNTNLKIAFRTNNLYNKLRERIPLNKINSSGIYKLKCKSCNNSYVGQTGRSIGIRHRVHTSYIKTNNPISAYALHILNNRHEYGNADQTIQLWNKGNKMNSFESFYIHIFKQENTLIDDQKVNGLNPLYTLANVTRRQVTS
jgi:hypothetical protein